jgi:hypothetical protein
MGASMTVHAVSFISVSYFDQNLIMWYLLQAIVSSMCTAYLDPQLRVKKTATGDDQRQKRHGDLEPVLENEHPDRETSPLQGAPPPLGGASIVGRSPRWEEILADSV